MWGAEVFRHGDSGSWNNGVVSALCQFPGAPCHVPAAVPAPPTNSGILCQMSWGQACAWPPQLPCFCMATESILGWWCRLIVQHVWLVWDWLVKRPCAANKHFTCSLNDNFLWCQICQQKLSLSRPFILACRFYRDVACSNISARSLPRS